MAKAKMDIKLKKVEGRACPKFRVSFPSVFESKAYKDQKPKFSITMLFDKSADLTSLKRAVKNAIIEKYGKDESEWPELKKPFKDGNKKRDLEGYKDTIVVEAWRYADKGAPQVIDKDREPITSAKDFYAGCYAKASLIAFCYGGEDGVLPGVSFSLQSLQKVGDGKKFSGSPDAVDEFDIEEDDSENVENYEKTETDTDDEW